MEGTEWTAEGERTRWVDGEVMYLLGSLWPVIGEEMCVRGGGKAQRRKQFSKVKGAL